MTSNCRPVYWKNRNEVVPQILQKNFITHTAANTKNIHHLVHRNELVKDIISTYRQVPSSPSLGTTSFFT
jgi:hypothetical protein